MLLGREKKERRVLKCILEGGILCQCLRKSVVHKLSAIKRGNQGDKTMYFLAGLLTAQFPSKGRLSHLSVCCLEEISHSWVVRIELQRKLSLSGVYNRREKLF